MTTPTHADLLAEVRQNRSVASEVKQTCEHLMRRMDDQTRHNALVLTSLQSLFQKAEDTEVAVGEIRAKVLRYDILGSNAKAWAIGVMGTLATSWLIIWYLIGDKVDAFLGKPHS